MADNIIESFWRYLEAEEQSDKILKLPSDTYSRFASYMQKIHKIADSNDENLATRLIKKQTEILQGITNRLLRVRLEKAKSESPSTTTANLLPEEKYLLGFYQSFTKEHDRFIKSLMNGQQSFFTSAYRTEMSKKVIIRFLKSVGEIIGFDLRRYGPFHIRDLALIPFGNAEVLVNNGEATFVHTRDSV